MVHRGRLVVVAVALLVGCKRTPPAPIDAGPPDRIGPQEFLEGKDSAFGLMLPLGARITYKYGETVIATTPLSPEQLSNYVSTRIRGGSIARGTAGSIFDNAIVVKHPEKFLRIEVVPSRGDALSELRVRDVSPPPLDPKMSEVDRWKRVGLTPDGKQIDRKNLQ